MKRRRISRHRRALKPYSCKPLWYCRCFGRISPCCVTAFIESSELPHFASFSWPDSTSTSLPYSAYSILLVVRKSRLSLLDGPRFFISTRNIYVMLLVDSRITEVLEQSRHIPRSSITFTSFTLLLGGKQNAFPLLDVPQDEAYSRSEVTGGLKICKTMPPHLWPSFIRCGPCSLYLVLQADFPQPRRSNESLISTNPCPWCWSHAACIIIANHIGKISYCMTRFND